MSAEHKLMRNGQILAHHIRREVFGPGLPEPEARTRVLGAVITTATIVVWGVVLVVCGLALTTLPWRACFPLCLATLAIGFIIAIHLGNRAARRDFPERGDRQEPVKTYDGEGSKRLNP
jgi:hypothetical protein